MCETVLYFNYIPTTVRVAGPVKVDRLCNSYQAINIGTTIAIVNGVPLNPPAAGEVLGDSFSEGGLKGEIYQGKIEVQFPGAAAGSQIMIRQKVYLADKENGIQKELYK